jgi:hypothetical protein
LPAGACHDEDILTGQLGGVRRRSQHEIALALFEHQGKVLLAFDSSQQVGLVADDDEMLPTMTK